MLVFVHDENRAAQVMKSTIPNRLASRGTWLSEKAIPPEIVSLSRLRILLNFIADNIWLLKIVVWD